MRIGVYGLGRIGVMHARNLAQDPEVDEVVLIGRDPARLASAETRVTEALGADAAPGLVTTTLDPLAEALPSLDGVVVATVTSTHAELALQVARAGTPLLIEKPLSLSSVELETLADELDSTGTPIMVAFHRRYDPGYRELHDRVVGGTVGPVRIVRSVNNDRAALSLHYIPESRGVWLDLLIHDFDILPWAVDDDVIAVQAFGSVLDEPTYAEYGDADTAVAVLELRSGAIATVVGTRRNGAGQDCRLEVFGSVGTVSTGIDSRTAVVSTEPGVPAPEATYPDYQERFDPAFRTETRHFLRMIRGEVESLTPPRSGLVATRIAEAAAESFSTGRRVVLAEAAITSSRGREA